MKAYRFAILVLIMAPWMPWAAADGGRYRQQSFYLARGPEYSLDDVVSDVRRRHEGRVLSADTVEQSGQQVHRVRILNDSGRVRGLRFDGNTGQPLPRENWSKPRR